MRILVTGGAGFIGSAFVRFTLDRYSADDVVVLDKLTYAGNLNNLSRVAHDPRYRFVRGDIADRDLVGELVASADAIVNFAAETHVDRSILDAGDFVHTDVYGTWVLAEAARKANVDRFVQVSTDEVYGSVERGASTEDAPLDPSSPYSASKAGGELLVHSYIRTYGLPALTVRGANAYGPYQYPEKLIPLHVTNALQDRPLPVYGDGQQRRQWTHVDDFVSGVDAVLRRGTPGQTYNVGNPEVESDLPPNLEVSRAILRQLGKPASLIQFVTDRPAHDRRYRVDPTKLLGLGWTPRWLFRDGLLETVRWYAANTEWWQPIKSGTYRAYYEQNYADRDRLVAAINGGPR
jgi:dTDP-glucose 4,6-dehydratase